MTIEEDALEYHRSGRPGKIEISPSKPCETDRDLSLAYSPGVAAPCIEIAKDPSKVFDYTIRGNLVAVISNGTAVLGLGDIGPLAAKPVMEGKCVLFKKFADIDAIDIEVGTKDAEEFIRTVKNLEPTFGGINLEDIKAPECFIIEEALRKEMKIPVFHDDQHGTAIISGAALLNAVEVTGRKLNQTKIVMNGAGASSIACARLFVLLGVPKNNIIMCDSSGTIYKGRPKGMNIYKEEFANETKTRTLSEALIGADVFVGLSVGGAVTPEMIKGMNDRPVVFAMANPTPEIMPDLVKQVRPDAIVATGRSDFPNQVNNVLGFPSIFRGALDVRATTINEEMKLAAVRALAALAREEIPESVSRAYGGRQFRFGPEYLIPKPFDTRVLIRVAPAVAKAAMDTGVAQKPIEDFDAYHDHLETMQGAAKSLIRVAINRVKKHAAGRDNLPRIAFPEASNDKVLKAIQVIHEEGIARPILLGHDETIRQQIVKLGLNDLLQLPIIRPSQSPKYEAYSSALTALRSRKGVHQEEAMRLMREANYYAAMMVHLGDADGMVNGATQNYADAVRPILQVVGRQKRGVAAGLTIIVLKDRILFCTDTTVNLNPTAEELATIAFQAAEIAQYFDIEPRIAMLSFSNFAARHEGPQKMKLAADLVRQNFPHLNVEGEMQADTAVNSSVRDEAFPFSELKKDANILVFPNLDSSNIGYKLVQQLAKAEVLGPFLLGVRRPAHVLQRSCSVNDIVNTVALAALHVQTLQGMRAERAKT